MPVTPIPMRKITDLLRLHFEARLSQRLKITLRQTHRAGEKMFVDYCGPTIPIIDPLTGEAREAQVFVAVLGASNYTYADIKAKTVLRPQTVSRLCGVSRRCLEGVRQDVRVAAMVSAYVRRR